MGNLTRVAIGYGNTYVYSRTGAYFSPSGECTRIRICRVGDRLRRFPLNIASKVGRIVRVGRNLTENAKTRGKRCDRDRG